VQGSLSKKIAVAAVAAVSTLTAPVSTPAARDASARDRAEPQLRPYRARPLDIGKCTMAVPSARATVGAEIANAADFCELVSHALASEVFHARVIVTSGRLWRYTDAALSCRLRYGHTRYRLTIHNSTAACRWLARLAPNWHLDPLAPPR
jgi:hypothetical protein